MIRMERLESVNMYIEYWLNQKSSNTGKSHDAGDLNKFIYHPRVTI